MTVGELRTALKQLDQNMMIREDQTVRYLLSLVAFIMREKLRKRK